MKRSYSNERDDGDDESSSLWKKKHERLVEELLSQRVVADEYYSLTIRALDLIRITIV